jgi:GNAT superfamily N-acetyltransferase
MVVCLGYVSHRGIDMIKEYFKEIQNLDIIENEHGFILYRIEDANLHIQHMYIKPESRAMKIATALADDLVAKAKDEGCLTMTGDIEPTNNNATQSMKFILSYGLKVLEASENEIIFYKHI